MDYHQDDDFDEPVRIHLNLDNLSEEEAKARFSLMYDEKLQIMKRRENNDYLRPICIDGMDVSNRLNHLIRKNMELFPVDKSVFNIRAISMTLWYFISRGHSAVVYLPTNLRDFAQKCSDPQELCALAKMSLIIFDETTPINPGSPVLLSKTIATSAENNDGCVLGSRKKYGLLGQKYPELMDRVTNSLIRPSFTSDNQLKISDSVRMVLRRDEVHRCDDNTNCMSFQLLVSDQVVIMSKLARIIGNNSMIDLCNRARELNLSSLANLNLRNNICTQKPSSSRVYSNPYHFNDPYLPEYVAPPQPMALESVVKPTRIGHKNSIYRVGGEKRVEEAGDEERMVPFRMALIDALEPMFGAEKANSLVRDNPEISEINDLIELGINQ
uniref:RNase NYN domain-containing protein n=1 Tax=Caenorhabditis japonica TaxID=281687 RepID=A0A8R1DHI4_CAEJA